MSNIISCPSCLTRLRLPEGDTGEVRCPKCKTTFSPEDSSPPVHVQTAPRRSPRDEPEDDRRWAPRRYDEDDEDQPRRGWLPRELPGKGVAVTAVLLLTLHIVSDAGVIACELTGLKVTLPQEPGAPPPGPGDRINPVGCLQILIVIPTIVLFCMWMYRSYANLRLMGVRGLLYSPGWAVGYFFIPILNLFRPCQVAQEMWRASDPTADLNYRDWGRNSLSAVIGFWWFFWILANIAGQIAFRITLAGNVPADVDDAVTIVASALSLLAGLFAILVILKLRRRQEEKLEALLQRGDEP
jgi:LSD1 subclass zinc finger protein